MCCEKIIFAYINYNSAANIIHIFDLSKFLSDKIENLMEINERINTIIEHKKLNIASFARAIGIADQTVRSVCVLRRNKPSFDFLNKIVHAFEWVNPEWLLTGRGEMVRPVGEPAREALPDLSALVDYMREKDRRIEKLIEEKSFWRLRCELRAH